MPNIKWEIQSYQVLTHRTLKFDRAGKSIEQTGAIRLSGVGNQSAVVFSVVTKDMRNWPDNYTDRNNPVLFFREEEFTRLIDVLRNERPVFLIGNTDTPIGLNSIVIETGKEFTGEGEA